MVTRLAAMAIVAAAMLPPPGVPGPPGRLVDVGGHRIHLNCSGRDAPTVVVENGLGDFSTDWLLVQQRVARFARICTYDRAGYAWSDPGPKPRTFDQLNLELHDVLAGAGEHGPYVLVAHSFGGGVARAYALRYPEQVAGLVFVDIVSEDQYIPMGPRAGRVGDDARGVPIPAPVSSMPAAGGTVTLAAPAPPARVEAPYDRLPTREQRIHAWASSLPALGDTEDSQRQWSAEYFARWAAGERKGTLGDRPLVVLTRARGGYREGLGMPAAELERIRLDAQRALATLSTAGTKRLVESGHSMHLEAPAEVEAAIREVVVKVRRH